MTIVGFPLSPEFFAGGKDLTTEEGGLRSILNAIDSTLDSITALTNLVIVESLSDLPTPSAGAIQLADDTLYRINGEVDIGTNHLLTATNTRIFGIFTTRDIVLYSGTGAAIRALSGAPLSLKSFGITAPNGSAMECVGGEVFVNTMTVVAPKFGSFDECSRIILVNCESLDIDDGIDISNTSAGGLCVISFVNLVQSVAGVGTMVDFGSSVWTLIRIDNSQLSCETGGISVSGLASSGNLVPVTGRGQIFTARLIGSGTRLAGITADDTLWEIRQTTGIIDTAAIGQISMSGNSTVTTIGGIGTFVKIAGTTTTDFTRRFDDDGATNNRLRYTGIEPVTVKIEAALSLFKTGGADIQFQVQIFKNGSAAGIPFDVVVDNKGNTISVLAYSDVVTNDFFEAYIAKPRLPRSMPSR